MKPCEQQPKAISFFSKKGGFFFFFFVCVCAIFKYLNKVPRTLA